MEEKEDKIISDNNIDSINVIEQENDRRKIQEKVSENIDILEIDNINIIEDKSRDALVDNENDENKTGPDRDVRSEKDIKEKFEEEKTYVYILEKR